MTSALIRGSIAINSSSLTKLVDRLEAARDALQADGIAAAYEEVGRRVQYLDIIEYPKATGGKMSDLWTPKQRRYFFAAELYEDMPYERTYDLGKAIRWVISVAGNLLRITAGIDARSRVGRYAKHVMGRQQSRYFRERTDWLVFSEYFHKKRAMIAEAVQVAFETVLEDLGLL